MTGPRWERHQLDGARPAELLRALAALLEDPTERPIADCLLYLPMCAVALRTIGALQFEIGNRAGLAGMLLQPPEVAPASPDGPEGS